MTNSVLRPDPNSRLPHVYPNNLKNWEFGEEAPQNSHLERANIVGVQGASEDENFEEKPTLPKTNSSSCLGIIPLTGAAQKKGIFAVFQKQIGKVVAYSNGKEYKLERVEQITKEAGSNPQIRALLRAADGTLHQVRIKQATSNEVRTYQQIAASDDPLFHYVPKFFGACAVNENTTSKNMFIILEDVTSPGDEINDFKFSKTALLCRNPQEIIAHHQTGYSRFATLFIHYFRKLVARFSFILSAPTKGTFATIRRFYALWKSESVLKAQLKRLSKPELENAIEELKMLKESLRESHFAVSDASLLYITDSTQRLKIQLIDMSHAIADDEGIENFREVKRDLVDSIEELIQFSLKLTKSNS